MTRHSPARQRRETTSPIEAWFSGHHSCRTLLTLLGCAALMFGSGVDHNHATAVAVDQDCVVCDSGSAKTLAAACTLAAPLAFGLATEVLWTAANPFLSRFSSTNPRAPPAQLAFV